ncbi:hypothetical protein KGY79_13095, partial [Candidatus Bipolaricaulota bacterium]|nr:hypothetical protein [Candidatus Bipolaricaulota bacterium]
GEEDLDGWTFYLYQDTCDSIGATSYTHGVTDANGDITFPALPAGSYCVEEDLKDHWHVTTDGGEQRDVTLSSGSTVTETFGNKFNLDVTDNLIDVDVTQTMLEDELEEATEEGRRYLSLGSFLVEVSNEAGSYTVVSYYLHKNSTPCINYSNVTGNSIIGIENGSSSIAHLSRGSSDPTELVGIDGSSGSASYPTYIDLKRIAEAGAPDTTCRLEIRVLFSSSLP